MSKKPRLLNVQEAGAPSPSARVQRVKLAVGNQPFHTSARTLRRDPHSRLADLLTTSQPDEDGVYRIDRDPKYFGALLNYLRDGAVDIPTEQRPAVKAEAAAYGLTKMVNWMSVFRPPELLLPDAPPTALPVFVPSRWLEETWGGSFSVTFQCRAERGPSGPRCLVAAGPPTGPYQPLIGLRPSGQLVACPPGQPIDSLDAPATPSPLELSAPAGSLRAQEWCRVCYVFDRIKDYLLLYIDEDGWAARMGSGGGCSLQPGVTGVGLRVGDSAGVSVHLKDLTLHHRALIVEEVASLLDDCEDVSDHDSERLPRKDPCALIHSPPVAPHSPALQVYPCHLPNDMEQ